MPDLPAPDYQEIADLADIIVAGHTAGTAPFEIARAALKAGYRRPAMTSEDKPILTEEITDTNGTYTQEWYCQPPPEGNAYHVTRCTWSPDHTVRKIYEIKLGEHW